MTSRLAQPTAAASPHPTTPVNPPSRAARRFAEEIVRLHDKLNYRRLPDCIEGEPLYRVDGRGDGLITLSVRQSQLPESYLRGVLGFRLAQFLQLGWMDPELAYRRALYHEPMTAPSGPETIHTLTLTDTGRIAGYVALVGSPDPVALPLEAPQRGLFPAEEAHHVELLTGFAAPQRTTHQVYEIKRFVKAGWMASGLQRDRVPWHLILAGLSSQPEMQMVVGDSREDGALRLLRLLGYDPVVIADTVPWLPRTELMWPSYELPEVAMPFAAARPRKLADSLAAIDTALGMDTATDWRGKAIADLMSLRRESGSAGYGGSQAPSSRQAHSTTLETERP